MKWWPANRMGRIRLALILVAFLGAAWLAHFQDYYYYYRYQPKEGDIVFQSLPHNDLVDAIEGITHSPYSHCGVVLKDENGVWVVIEAIGAVRETPLLPWIKRGRGGDFTVYRLDPKYDKRIPAFEQATGEKMGELEKLRDLDWKPFSAFIMTEQRGALPLDRLMITPASLAQARQLREVYRSGF
jgi:hypothetical protein